MDSNWHDSSAMLELSKQSIICFLQENWSSRMFPTERNCILWKNASSVAKARVPNHRATACSELVHARGGWVCTHAAPLVQAVGTRVHVQNSIRVSSGHLRPPLVQMELWVLARTPSTHTEPASPSPHWAPKPENWGSLIYNATTKLLPNLKLYITRNHVSCFIHEQS